MKIAIQIVGDSGATAETTFNTHTMDPVKEGRAALLRLVRMVQETERYTAYSITLAATPRKIQVIKFVREMTKLGLKEAKELVDNLGGTLVDGLTAEEARVWTRGLDEQGAVYEVRCK